MTASPSSRPPSHRRPARRWMVGVHAALVAVAALALLVLWSAGGPDANIGAGLAQLLVLVLGLPWSLPLLLNPDAVAWPWPPVIAIVLAVLNVGLHAGLRRWAARRPAR